MSERETDLSSPSWYFSSHGVSRQAQEHASCRIRYVAVFQRVGVSQPTRGLQAYAGSDTWSSMKSVGSKRERRGISRTTMNTLKPPGTVCRYRSSGRLNDKVDMGSQVTPKSHVLIIDDRVWVACRACKP